MAWQSWKIFYSVYVCKLLYNDTSTPSRSRCNLPACLQAACPVASSLATPRMDCELSQIYTQWICSAVAGNKMMEAWGVIS